MVMHLKMMSAYILLPFFIIAFGFIDYTEAFEIDNRHYICHQQHKDLAIREEECSMFLYKNICYKLDCSSGTYRGCGTCREGGPFCDCYECTGAKCNNAIGKYANANTVTLHYILSYGRTPTWPEKPSIIPFIEHIKKDFMDSSQAISFVIRLYRLHNAANVESLTLENIQTNEKLVIEKMGEDKWMSIRRYPMDAIEEWIKGMEQKPQYKYRYITIEI